MEIRKVGVVGLGQMGLGVVQAVAGAGFDTVAVKATPGAADPIRGKLEKDLGKLVEKGKMEGAAKDALLSRVRFTSTEADLKDCSLVIESIVEDLSIKQALFKRLEGIVSKDAILA